MPEQFVNDRLKGREQKGVSLCITTCDRLNLLQEAVRSCQEQTLKPCEILIGDDSRSDETENWIAGAEQKTDIPIRYFRNKPRLGQNANVNSLFLKSAGTHLVLLHDDDLLTPIALETLLRCWEEHPDLTAAYGKQFIISPDGKVDQKASEALNRTYHRTSSDAGLQPSSWRVGLSQQFPNNGYMLRAEAAKDTLWRSMEEVGYGGEFDFGLRLGLRYSKFYFVDVYTSCYRLTAGPSISSSSRDDAALQSFRITRDTPLPEAADTYRVYRLKEFAPRAIMQAIRVGYKEEAWAIFWSRHHTWRRRLSLGGVRKLLLLLMPPYQWSIAGKRGALRG